MAERWLSFVFLLLSIPSLGSFVPPIFSPSAQDVHHTSSGRFSGTFSHGSHVTDRRRLASTGLDTMCSSMMAVVAASHHFATPHSPVQLRTKSHTLSTNSLCTNSFNNCFLHNFAPPRVRSLTACSAKRSNNWWRDVGTVREELLKFCAAHGLPRDRMPTEIELRAHSGGMPIIHAIRMHGGVRSLSEKLQIPSAKALMQRRREEEASERAGARAGGGEVGLAWRQAVGREQDREGEGEGGMVALASGGREAAGGRERSRSEGARSEGARGKYGRFADGEEMKKELLEFGAQQTNNPSWRVMPSARQMRHSGRSDLANAVVRYGGSATVAARFRMLSSAEFAYYAEFLGMLKELRQYNERVGAPRSMPSLKELRREGRHDLAKLLIKHGGQNVLAARLDLHLPRKRKPFLYWGHFDLDFAIDMLEIAQDLALRVGENSRIVMPTEEQLEAQGRKDLAEQIRQFGGREDVARRLGMDCGLEA